MMKPGDTFQVLDHGYVKFIDSMGTDETVIEAARMSTGKGFEGWAPRQRTFCKTCGEEVPEGMLYEGEGGAKNCHSKCWSNKGIEITSLPGDERLLDYLYRNKHMTPFEMCELAIEVQAPIFVFREWHRHRTMSFNEMSARYTQMPNLHYVPTADRNGVPKEVARVNTPVSRYSRMRAKTDLRNWLGFLNLRLRENAQWEIRQYAQAVAGIIFDIWPRTYQLFANYDLRGTSFSEQETQAVLCGLIGAEKRAVGTFAGMPGVAPSAVADFRKKLGLDK